jgi:ceramide glucosyltransferase
MDLAAAALLMPALAGCAYTIGAACVVGRYRAMPVPVPALVLASPPAITILKPLCGAEPQLYANLETMLRQHYPGAVQIVFGVRDSSDPAAAVVQRLQAAHPAADCTLVIDPQRHGANNKMANVINMMPHARHGMLVLADSDVAWPGDVLVRLMAVLADTAVEPALAPPVGIASCLHTGRGDAGFWSVLGAMDISYRFLPSVAVACATGLARPCLGPTMAFSRASLDAAGGFTVLADVLADDHALGAAIAAGGQRCVVPPFTIVHAVDDASVAALLRHELRWTRTIAGIDRAGFIGSVLTHPLPLALIGLATTGFAGAGWAVLLLALACRAALKWRVDRVTATRSGPHYLLPLRDIVSFVVFVATFFGQTVHWRGTRYAVTRGGRLRTDEGTG